MLKEFHESEDGAIVILSLLLLPILLGFGLILIDAGRGNSAHGDLQAAADAIALAGARELDGGADALDRARTAMALIDNSVSLLAVRDDDGTVDENELRIEIAYDGTDAPFLVRFLDAIPDDDTTPITASWLTDHATTDPSDAQYVYVYAQSRNLQTIFGALLPKLSRGETAAVGSLPVGATAVAKSESAACDIPPLFICNPFEYDASGNYVGDGLQMAFQRGDLHGRMIRLHPSGNETPMPGNFGFLDVSDADVSTDADPSGGGARSINDYFAGQRNRTCYGTGLVRTKPGASNGVRTGINARFDMYGGRYQSGGVNGQDAFTVRTALNVRKGIMPGSQGNNIDDCVMQGNSLANGTVVGDDHVWTPDGFNANGETDPAYGLPDNLTMNAPNTGGLVTSDDVAGAYIGIGEWAGQTYLDRNYGVDFIDYESIPSSFPGVAEGYSGPGTVQASRYDVYQYELETDVTVDGVTMPLYQVRAPGDADEANPTPTGESGEALCLAQGNGNGNSGGSVIVTDPDPRVLVAAIIDCGENADETGRSDLPVNSYASIFMARPMISYAPGMDMTIDVEVIDITGYGGNGTLETFIREESVLVR